MKRILTLALLLALFAASCKIDDSTSAVGLSPKLPAQPYDYSLKVSSVFFNPLDSITTLIDPINPNNNSAIFGFGFNMRNPAVRNAGATLGRVLFYDPKLSINNAISCASCHKQSIAFSDDKAGSVGFGGKITPRNSMAIINAGFNNNLFWDSREQSVLDLATRPIQNHIEMGMEDLKVLSSKLGKVDYYPDLFEAAYGSPEVTEKKISDAISQFVCAITSTNSKFDRERAKDFAGFTPLEAMGRELFFSARTNCSRCHAGPNFSAPDFVGGEYGGGFGGGEDLRGTANNGLDLQYADQGLGNGKFRIPSLRNIALTAPYMHDGRFNTLEQVIEHYNSGIQNHPKLDKNLRAATGGPLRPNLNELEKRAMTAFLVTLTDEKMVQDVRFSNPFK